MSPMPENADDLTPEDLVADEADAAIDYVRENPIRALVAAAALGFVIGRLPF